MNDKAKKNISIALTGRKLSIEHRNNISLGSLNHTVTEQTKKKISNKNKGHAVTDATKLKISKSSIGRTLSKETRRKISKSRIGMKHSEDTKAKLSTSAQNRKPPTANTKSKIGKSLAGIKQELAICPHCGKEGGVNAMKRYHFNNCKHKEVK
jgi:hypothetical protein